MTPRNVVHKLKIENQWMSEIAAGRKTAELRRDDRDYQIGDRIQFFVNGVSYCAAERTITHVLKNFVGLEPGYVVLSLNHPDYDWHVETAKRRSEWLATAERRIAALKGVITKQRKKHDELMEKYRRLHDSYCDYRDEALKARREQS